MKYTKYIINGSAIDPKALESIPKILLPITLSAAIIGFIFLTGILPMAATMDGFRTIKCGVIKFERKYHFAHNVVDSKAFNFAVVRPFNYVVVNPINIVVINPIHNVLKNVA